MPRRYGADLAALPDDQSDGTPFLPRSSPSYPIPSPGAGPCPLRAASRMGGAGRAKRAKRGLKVRGAPSCSPRAPRPAPASRRGEFMKTDASTRRRERSFIGPPCRRGGADSGDSLSARQHDAFCATLGFLASDPRNSRTIALSYSGLEADWPMLHGGVDQTASASAPRFANSRQ